MYTSEPILVILSLPFLSQILPDPLKNLLADWKYVQLTGDLFFIKKSAFLVELQMCYTTTQCYASITQPKMQIF